MRRFFHPPPPASSLTRFDRHHLSCHHLTSHHLTSHHLTSLLLVLCLALGLVACQSGGSSASSSNSDENISVKDGSDSSGNDDSDINGDETPTLVDNADISIADLSDSSKSIISMREFLLTVTYNNLNTQQELNFIVGESTTPPTWNSVKANPTKITRAFNNGNLKTRRIYFSATEKLTDVSFDADGNATITGKVIDLSQDGQTEAQITKAQAAGIMVPDSSYYVYVYDSRGALVKQQTVTTAGYPTDASSFPLQLGDLSVNPQTARVEIGEYFWGMDAWRDANGAYQIIEGVEVKQGEVFFLPLRTHTPIDWDLDSNTIQSSYCKGGITKTLRFRIFIMRNNATIFSYYPLDSGKSSPDSTNNLFSFIKSPAIFQQNILPASETDEMIDQMYLAKLKEDSGGNTIEKVSYDVYFPCLNGHFQSNFSNVSFDQKAFEEITE